MYAVKFRVERDVLAEAVSWVARGLPARPPVPVLSGILLVADAEGTVTLSAFDYEVSAKITIAADVAEPGTVLVLGLAMGLAALGASLGVCLILVTLAPVVFVVGFEAIGHQHAAEALERALR